MQPPSQPIFDIAARKLSLPTDVLTFCTLDTSAISNNPSINALIVGVNSDASVRRQKGPGRPIQSQDDRSHIVAAQACVDAVVLFDQDTPVQLLKAIKPDVLTKGGDYKVKRDVVGWKMVEDWGGRVELIPLIQGRSTSKLICQAKKRR